MNYARSKKSNNKLHECIILIIDDNPKNLSVAAEMLSDLGATVIISRNGKSGLKRAQYAQPDLILLDILMPEMNGFDVCFQLKKNAKTHGIPVIFMTALSETTDKVKGLQSGGVDYITKPFEVEELLARITNHLKMQRFIREIEAQNQELKQLVTSTGVSHLPESAPSNLQQAINYIQSHLTQNITLEEIATTLGMSQFYFCRWFKQSMGIAPYQYVLQQRIKLAKLLLVQHPKMSIADIALECGFSSQSHLNRHFRQQTGITPMAYRQQ